MPWWCTDSLSSKNWMASPTNMNHATCLDMKSQTLPSAEKEKLILSKQLPLLFHSLGLQSAPGHEYFLSSHSLKEYLTCILAKSFYYYIQIYQWNPSGGKLLSSMKLQHKETCPYLTNYSSVSPNPIKLLVINQLEVLPVWQYNIC